MKQNFFKINFILASLLGSACSAYATIATINPGDIITASYLNSMGTAINDTIDGTGVLTNTGIAAIADHVYYVSPTSISQDLCEFINNLSISGGQAITIVLAPANSSSGTNEYLCSANVTLPANTTLISSGNEKVANAQWLLGDYHLTLQSNDTIKGVAISGADSSASATTAVVQVTAGATVDLENDIIQETVSGSADAISVTGSSGSTTVIYVKNSIVNVNNSGSSSYSINLYDDATTLDINSSQIGVQSGGNSNAITNSAALTLTAENNSILSNVAANNSSSTLTFRSSTGGTISSSAGSINLFAYGSILGTVSATLSATSLLSASGINGTNIPSAAKCIGSYNTNNPNYLKLNTCQ